MLTHMNSKIEHALVLFYNRRYHPIIVRRLLAEGVRRVDTVVVNLGDISDPESLTAEIKRCGSEEVYFLDKRDVFSDDYLTWAIKSNACYEGKYYLSAAIARPCLVNVTTELARKIGADVVVHQFRGNDMVRMNMGYQSLDMDFIPALSLFKIEESEVLSVAKELDIPEEFGTCNPFSVSDNIWGRSIECGSLEDLSVLPTDESYCKCKDLSRDYVEPELVSIGFSKGVPVSLNGGSLKLREIIEELNESCGRHGIGRHDLMEDGSVGFKTRAIYEHPAATCLIYAHKELEHLVLNKHELDLKRSLDGQFSKNIYDGLWFDPVMDHIKTIMGSLNQYVDGEVRLRLMNGTFDIEKRFSPNSLYNGDVSVYNYGHLFSADDAAGYGNTFNLHTSWTNRIRRKI